MASGCPHWHMTVVGPEQSVTLSVAKNKTKQYNTLEVKEEPIVAWGMRLGSSEIPNSQPISLSPRDFESVEANRSPGHLKRSTP